MRADPYWVAKPAEFWHYVRVLSENIGYSRSRRVLRHTPEAIRSSLRSLDLSTLAPDIKGGREFSIEEISAYFDFRADLIETVMARYLQTASEASALFQRVVDTYTTGYDILVKNGVENGRLYSVLGGVPAVAPYNKQKGSMRDIDFLTASSNILISYHLNGEGFDQDPRRLPVATNQGLVVGSMSRRMDGAYPSCTNPIALWEFKCYYYTTTFGSKISDAVYIADLDGYERNAVEVATQRPLDLTLFIDAYSTWMEQGKSYLCRIVDLLHRGAVDNLVVGAELETAIPEIVERWHSL